MDNKAHWERVYSTRRSDEVSWYQPEPATSFRLIQQVAPQRDARILDVGGGASVLVDRLLQSGYSRVSVLDLAGAPLKEAQNRLPENLSRQVTWIEGDVLSVTLPKQSLDVWHDWAVFHFLTAPEATNVYVAQVRRALRRGGHVVIATFAEDGPPMCSGLPVARYGPDAVHAIFGDSFRQVDTVRELHTTPAGGTQPFQYCVCQFDSSEPTPA